jgi:hypothetical protein
MVWTCSKNAKPKNAMINCNNYNGMNKEKEEDHPKDEETRLKRT